MKKAKYLLPIVLVAALVAGCGGGGSAKLKTEDVAVVGSQHIPKTMGACCVTFQRKG